MLSISPASDLDLCLGDPERSGVPGVSARVAICFALMRCSNSAILLFITSISFTLVSRLSGSLLLLGVCAAGGVGAATLATGFFLIGKSLRGGRSLIAFCFPDPDAMLDGFLGGEL